MYLLDPLIPPSGWMGDYTTPESRTDAGPTVGVFGAHKSTLVQDASFRHARTTEMSTEPIRTSHITHGDRVRDSPQALGLLE